MSKAGTQEMPRMTEMHLADGTPLTQEQLTANDLMPTTETETALQEAQRLVHGDRAEQQKDAVLLRTLAAALRNATFRSCCQPPECHITLPTEPGA